MCGIAGIVAWQRQHRIEPGVLEQMSARLAHRGPDAQGVFLSAAHPQCGLAHRRLAILDLDARANQPMSDAQGRYIVFNGEIYNFRELRAELSALRGDYAWRTNS